jgi:hypothetical protein
MELLEVVEDLIAIDLAPLNLRVTGHEVFVHVAIAHAEVLHRVP